MMLTDEQKANQSARAQNDYNIFKSVNQYLHKYTGGIIGKNILDIGCGSYFPQPILYNTFGCSSIVGIDLTTFVTADNLSVEMQYYFQKLSEYAGKPLKFENLRVLNVDAREMPFQDDYFDLVISNAALEHIHDIPSVIRELKRVMKKGAIGHIGIHLFPSLSGSHHPLLQKHQLEMIPQGVVPWYHLRGIKDYEDETLNKWREYQYKEAFSNNFEILDWRVPSYEEGANFLTENIKRELIGYSEEELLRRWCIAVIRNSV